jgi:hyaluronoglucosaminidase
MAARMLRRLVARATTRAVGAGLAVLVGATAAFPSAARWQGVIEGYYGLPWSGPARRDVLTFMGAHHMNTFVYAPKNDDFHRAHWRDPYPADQVADFAATATTAARAHVAFVYGLTPALDVCYSCGSDRTALTHKLGQLLHAHVRRFALLFDDAPATLTVPADVAHYGGSDAAALARAQADLANRTGRWLRAHHATLAFLVPTDYAGTDCHPYHAALAQALHHRLPVGWTGPGVFAATITANDARARAACLPHRPVVLWDNFPVNDTFLSINLHLGPLTGRDADLVGALRGHLLNPMTQPHASMIPLATAGAYFADPSAYDPEGAWQAALAELGNGGGLAVLAAQTRSSALDLDDARALGTAVDDATATWPTADWVPAVDALSAEETRQAAANGDITTQLGGTPLGDEIAPWVGELAAHAARGAEAVALLRALKPAFVDVQTQAANGMVEVSGQVVPPDVSTAATLGPGFAADAVATAARIAMPPFGGLLACLGDFLGADIHFCTTYGLNVHGKSLFVLVGVPPDIRIVSDRNVHDRLVELAGTTYASWTARQPAGALTLTADDAAASVDMNGAFTLDVPAPPSGHVRLVVTTAAGDATALVVP